VGIEELERLTIKEKSFTGYIYCQLYFGSLSGRLNCFNLQVRHERDAEIAEIKRDIAMQKRRWKPVYRYFAAYLWTVC
jgi:hypothetical protein